MDLPEPAPTAEAPTRRADLLTLLFLFFLMVTLVCLYALREPSSGAPAPEPPPARAVGYA